MFCGLPISVAADPIFAAQASPREEGQRIETPREAYLHQHGRDREADDVVAEHRRKPRDRENERTEEPRRRERQRSDAARGPRVEAAETQPGGHHHEREEQDQGRRVNRAPGFLQREGADRHQRDRAEQRDAGAVKLQERQPAEYHPCIHDEENQDDRGFGYHGRRNYRLNAASMRQHGIAMKGRAWPQDLLSA
jgi:hypothetical protein